MTSCAPTLGSKTRSVACEVFSPITWSKKDTRPTVRQIVGHNAAYKGVCKKGL